VKYRIIIADDHPIVRAGLKQIIMEDAGITVAGEAENGNDLLTQVRHQDYVPSPEHHPSLQYLHLNLHQLSPTWQDQPLKLSYPL